LSEWHTILDKPKGNQEDFKMSKFTEFYIKLTTEPAVSAEFDKIIKDMKIPDGTPFADLNDEQISALIPLAEKTGFEFTLEEVKAYFAKMGNDELSDSELEAVAGGKGTEPHRCDIGILYV
jgi:hypothetical protein